MMTRKRNTILAGVAVLAAAGLGTGVGVAATGSSSQPPAAGAAASSAAYTAPSYSWYRSMISGYYGNGGGMMGGSSGGWTMSQAGYRWMTGDGATSPGWMTGALPSAMMGAGMMGSGTDPGTIMGRLFAGAPGPRVSAAQATALGNQVPAGASVNRAGRTIVFTSMNVSLVVLASPSMPAESFRIAGMTDPAITVPAGAHVSIELINADADMAHGLIVTASDPAGSWMPMMTARPAFTGSALWFLGNPTSAGLHEGKLTFTATTLGTYHYLCPVPGHAGEGMAGILTVR